MLFPFYYYLVYIISSSNSCSGPSKELSKFPYQFQLFVLCLVVTNNLVKFFNTSYIVLGRGLKDPENKNWFRPLWSRNWVSKPIDLSLKFLWTIQGKYKIAYKKRGNFVGKNMAIRFFNQSKTKRSVILVNVKLTFSTEYKYVIRREGDLHHTRYSVWILSISILLSAYYNQTVF